jgi:hypothetical protein
MTGRQKSSWCVPVTWRSGFHYQTLKSAPFFIPISPVVRNIGFYLDVHLSMEYHVQRICRVCYFHIFSISKIRHLLDCKTTETLVHAYVTSRLDSFNSLLFDISDYLLAKLQRVQNAAARLITRTKKRQSITPVLKQLHWLPGKSRIEYKMLLLVYRILQHQAPVYLTNLVSYHQPTRALRSTDAQLLSVPRSRLATYGDRAFSRAAPRLWNNLSLQLRMTTSEYYFKKQLKTYLFNQVFNWQFFLVSYHKFG